MIANRDYTGVINATINDFERYFSIHNYSKAWWIYTSNLFFRTVYGEERYRLLFAYFLKYRSDMMQCGVSSVFDGVNSVQDIMKNL